MNPTCPICTAPNAQSNISELNFYSAPGQWQWLDLPLCAECKDTLEPCRTGK